MNNQKQQKPTLSGQRFKARKRDEKDKFDPTQFQDCIIQGLTEIGTDLEAVAKFLGASGAKLDYHRYAETLFDVLMAGRMLAPGGTLADGTMCTDVYVFAAPEDLETMQAFAQVFNKLIRHSEYLEKSFEDEVKKLLLFLKGFSELERNKLTMLTGSGTPLKDIILYVKEEMKKKKKHPRTSSHWVVWSSVMSTVE